MTAPVRIPADVDMQDRILGPLTARQLAILAVTGMVLWAAWTALGPVVPVAAFLAAAAPVAVASAVLALGQRDGISMDRLALAAVRQRLAPRRYAAAEEEAAPVPAWLSDTIARSNARAAATQPVPSPSSPIPARQVTATDAGSSVGMIDLGPDGLAAVAAASTVNFALRTPEEQDALVALFSRFLHSLTAPVQILVRAHRLDLSDQISDLRDGAAALPHPALRSTALDHAQFLAELDRDGDLLRRQILIVLREPFVTTGGGARATRGFGRRRAAASSAPQADAAARRAAQARLARRLSETTRLLSPAGITVTPLDPAQAAAVLRTACNPDTFLPPTAVLAPPAAVIAASDSVPPPEPERDAHAGQQSAPRPRTRQGATDRRSA